MLDGMRTWRLATLGGCTMQGIAAGALRRLKRPELVKKQAFVAGAWLDGGAVLPVVDPATGELLVDVTACGVEAVDRAIEAAQEAFPAWRDKVPVERGNILRNWAASMRANMHDLAVIITAEQGKPLDEARSEITYAAAYLDWFAAEGERALWRDDPQPSCREPFVRPYAANRGDSRDHALELSKRYDHAQGRRRPRRRVCNGGQARA
jgi:delta 1-pyrroline-5-carboxylate dehydrogenase